MQYVTVGGARANYRYAGSAFSMVATPTVAIVIQGSATKTVAVKRIALNGGATAAGSMPVVLTRRSAAGTLGSAVLTAVTGIKHQSSDASASATVSTVGTANYGTPGTSVGTMGAARLTMVALGSAATSGEGKPVVWEFGNPRGSKPVILASDSEWLTVDFSGAAIPSGGVLDYEIETEEY